MYFELSCIQLPHTTCKETWIKLHRPNVWLFTLCNKQLMRVICRNHVTPAVIDETEVIVLKPKCILQKNDATLFTYNHLGNKLNMNSNITINTLNSTINNIFHLSWKNVQLNITQLDFLATDFRKVKRQLAYQKQPETLPVTSNITSHDVYFYSVTSLLLETIATFLLYCIIKRCIKKKAKETQLFEEPKKSKEEIEMRDIRIHSTHLELPKRFTFENISK